MNLKLLIQISLSVILTFVILLQGQGGGLGSSFGGSTSYHTKRGVEKGLFIATIILAFLFTTSSVINLL